MGEITGEITTDVENFFYKITVLLLHLYDY